MPSRNPLALLGILLGLVVVIFLLARSGGVRPEKKEVAPAALYPGLDTSRVDRIGIRADENETKLVREEGLWKVADEERFAADPDGVKRILESLAAMNGAEVVSRRPEKYELFEVDSASAVEVDIGAGGDTVAHFFVGKSGADYRSTYVRDAGRVEVFLQGEPLKGVYDRGSRTWKDKGIFRFDGDKAGALEIERSGELLRFENDFDGGWTVAKPEGFRPKGSSVSSVVRGLERLTCTDFAAEEERAAAGLDEPEAVVRVFLQDEDDRTLRIGAKKEGGGTRYVARDSDDILYLVSEGRLASFLQPSEELIEPIPPDTAAAEEQPAKTTVDE